MTGNPTHPRPHRLLTGLCWLLAAAFTMGAITKFLPGETFFGPPYAEKFADWGYPSWFRFIVGTGELVGAVLLLMPRRRFAGAVLLGVVLVGAGITHIVNQDSLEESVAAPVTLVLVGVVAWMCQPADLTGGSNRGGRSATMPAAAPPTHSLSR